MNTGRACVYCGDAGRMTGEHVIPDCFQKALDVISIVKTSDGDKAIYSAQEIHDVCARCSNGPLSELDNYLCALNGEYFSVKTIRPGDCINFQFDFDLLVRMLLKIGYNIARTRDWPIANWQETTRYVVGCATCPPGFRVFLQLLIPTPAEKTSLPVLPMPWRTELRSFPGLAFEYSISFWSYRFFVLREDMKTRRGIRRQVISRWLRSKNREGTCELNGRDIVTVYASSVMVLDALRDSPMFSDQLSKAKELKSAMNQKQRPKLRSSK